MGPYAFPHLKGAGEEKARQHFSQYFSGGSGLSIDGCLLGDAKLRRVKSTRLQTALLVALLAIVGAAIVAYSQLRAFAWDEGFHIVTAQLILRGKRPYLDFCFSQTPLNAYWNAFWMSIFGDSWRTVHAAAAVSASLATAVTGWFVLHRFPEPERRIPGAFLVAVLMGLNVVVFRYGGISQAYGLCLVLLVSAYWCAVVAVESGKVSAAMLAGLFCAAAAGSSLLTAPAVPILFAWILVNSAGGARVRKLGAFVGGALVALSPVLWLFAQNPKQVWFGIVDYNLKYRLVDWPPPDANRQNLEVAMAWIGSGPALVLILLGIAGFRATRRAELRLCGWLAAGLGLYIGAAVRPTFPQYLVFTVPFLAILSVAGIADQWPNRKWAPVLVASFLVVFGLGKSLYDERDDSTWQDFERVALKVDEVTPKGAMLMADEVVYFLTKRTPPEGNEERNSHKLEFGKADAKLYHIRPQSQLDREALSGVFATLETCEDEDYIAEKGFAKVFAKKAEVEGCTVFWDYKGRK